ncbi:MAG: hypothetical protein COB66_03970 [Coxiella sp. (in: Bacteria)]|nr:MAG: hypothetical protein COB66_03970 [Coxiella sp. (in: g-proteobacteria)]
MKIHTSSFSIEVGAALGQLLLVLLVAYVVSNLNINLYYFQWTALAFILCLVIFKSSTPTSYSLSRRQAITKIFIFQLALFALFYGISNVFGPHTFTTAITACTWQLGLFPWAYMILIAVGLRLTCQQLSTDSSLIDLLGTFFKINTGSQTWALLFMLVRQATNFIISLTLALIFFNLYSALVGKPAYFSVPVLILSVLIFILVVAKLPNKLYKKVIHRKLGLFISIPLMALIISLFLCLIGYLLSGLSTAQTHAPALLAFLNHTFKPNHLAALFSDSWWLSWVAIGGVVIAHYSRSLTIRQLIFISGLLPLLLGLLLKSNVMNTVLTTHHWSVIVAIIALVVLLRLLFARDMLPNFILTTLPIDEAPRQRAHQFYLVRGFRVFLMILFFSVPIGLQALGFFSVLYSLVFIEFALFIIIAMIPLCTKR